MQNMSVISALIMKGNEGALGLYIKIPYFLRNELDASICVEPWDKVAEGCEMQDPHSFDCASIMYQSLLAKADEYIKINNQIDTQMRISKYIIENEFKNDAARFVSEMAKCLKMEKELIFTFNAAGNAGTENSDTTKDDISNHIEDLELTAIEEEIKEAGNHLYQAKKCIEDYDKCREIAIELSRSINQDVGMGAEDLDAQQMINEFVELQNQDISCGKLLSQIQYSKQRALDTLRNALQRSLHYVDKLVNDMKTWRVAQAKWSVRVGPAAHYTFLINKFKRFGDCINTVTNWFLCTGNLHFIRENEQKQSPDLMNFNFEVASMQSEFRGILHKLIQIIETIPPKGDISIENKGKKGSPNYCTKKTQSFSATIRVLAGECFPNFQIMDMEVELVAEKDLARGSSESVAGREAPSLKVAKSVKSTVPEITFNIEVKNFYRAETNNVYKQFLRLRYKVTVSINGHDEYTLETLSLPFTFNTGANQILEHKGARLWYCASVNDLYDGKYQCPDTLQADELITILDNRVTYIDAKSRRLTEQEKDFLKGRLPVSSDGTVTMQGFVKDKMRTMRNDEQLSYSFYTWFYSVIHSLEQLLLKAWQDGIIYGFCSPQTAEDILMDPGIPEGTVLLRPSVSEIEKTSSAEATAALVMEIKLRNENAQPFDDHRKKYNVHSIPLFYKHIEEYTLYDAVKGIRIKNATSKSIAKFLYVNGKGQKLDILKSYSKKPERRFLPEYSILLQKLNKLKIIPSRQPTAAEEVSDGDDDNKPEPPKRKRRYRKSSSNTQTQSTSQLPSISTGMDNLPGVSSTLPIFNVISAEMVKQETMPQLQLQARSPDNVQCQRSGTQGQIISGSSDRGAVNESMEVNENCLVVSVSGHETFGHIQVDVSKIAATHVQSVHMPQEPGTNSFEHADFGRTNSDHRGATPQLYNIQYQDNRVNEPSGSPAYHVTVVSSPASGDYSLQDLNPASFSSNYSEASLSSPGNSRMSPPQMNVQMTENLPTVLTEAAEPNRHSRRRGNGRRRNTSPRAVNSQVSSSSDGRPQMSAVSVDQSTRSHLQLIQNSVQNHSFFSENSLISNDSDLSALVFSGSFSNFEDIILEGITDSQLMIAYTSPADSGMGDQSPSPDSSWNSNPLLEVKHSGSILTGQQSPSMI